MPDIDDLVTHAPVSGFHAERWRELLRKIHWGTTVNILIVVDTDIGTLPGVGFGINRVIDLVRTSTIGCMRFNVDIGVRSAGAPTIVASPAPFTARYTAFRFDMKEADGVTPVLHRYQQVWCFGFKPDNFGGPDSNINQPGAFPSTDAELATLSKWMDERKGGVFATGDHDYLGASMCHRIPRVRTMRRWTNADGVPPIDTPDRLDTLRPGTEPLGNSTDQEDTVPQPIRWVPWSTIRLGWHSRLARPHPVLCHPTLGPIDVMPDHAHEGLCFDNAQVNLAGSYNFDGAGAKPEYPNTATGVQARPLVIAYGSTLGSPPYTFVKGLQPYRPSFPMISVYDGHPALVGRVAVDSTWHHWMNVNIDNLALAGGNHWEKIKRYFLNLAVWLNPPGYTTKCIWDHIIASHFGYAGAQEYSPRLDVLELGAVVRADLLKLFGPCWITQFFIDTVFEFDPKLRQKLLDRYVVPVGGGKGWPPVPDPCLSCPPLELLEDAVLGGIVRATLEPIVEVRRQVDQGKAVRSFSAESLAKVARQGARAGLADFGKLWEASMKESQTVVKAIL